MMKTEFPALSLFAGLLLASGSLLGADAKSVTISGEGMCAKCAMHEGDSCQTVIQVTENGKQVVYYLAANDLSKQFHKNVCKGSAKVTAVGTVEVKDGKSILTATELSLAK